MDGWMNQAYSRLSTTHGHITDPKGDGPGQLEPMQEGDAATMWLELSGGETRVLEGDEMGVSGSGTDATSYLTQDEDGPVLDQKRLLLLGPVP